jgi:hypothetical protein
MNKNTQIQAKKELQAVKDMALNLAVNSVELLNPAVWVSLDTALMAIGNIGRNFVKGRLQKMFTEVQQMRDEEKINEEVLASEKTTHVILDFSKFLAQENPDMETWDAAKKIFLRTLEKDVNEQKRASLYESLSICKELSGTEIRILAGAYQIHKRANTNGNYHYVTRWAIDVAQEIGLETAEEILRYEDNMVKQKLISPRESLNGTMVDTWNVVGESSGHRLTGLGRKLAESFTVKT